jgi:F0F1-type ATP synthase assembly protein I
VIAIVVGYFGGRFLDRWLGTDPYCSYVGLILGIVAGFRNLFRLARSAASSPTDSPSSTSSAATAPEPVTPPETTVPSESKPSDSDEPS